MSKKSDDNTVFPFSPEGGVQETADAQVGEPELFTDKDGNPKVLSAEENTKLQKAQMKAAENPKK